MNTNTRPDPRLVVRLLFLSIIGALLALILIARGPTWLGWFLLGVNATHCWYAPAIIRAALKYE
jgi:hypothetical protein